MKSLITLFAVVGLLLPTLAIGQSIPDADAYLFVRDDCSHCQDLEEFIDAQNLETGDYTIHRIDITTESGSALFDKATNTLGTGKVTPIGLVDGQVYVGYAQAVLGQALLDHAADTSRTQYPYDLYLETGGTIDTSGKTCEEGSLEPCAPEETPLTIPVLGEINPQTISLSGMAIALGFVDGFNPCAMWVLLTFLLILSQLGSKRKMIEIAGLFIIAEAVMYFLILNVWYQTWDFIALDSIVTPLVGLLALGSGSFFIYKYYSSRDKALTCDVTSVEHQSKVENRIRELATKPLTLAVALAVIGLAFSVNVIEFACSIGIPQAFTKVLELNNLSFIEYQGYTMLYTLFYMADDFIVFALAIWGYSKFYAVGQKYSRYATLVAGILMLALGALLVFSPDILAF
jgi:cytochrome c biogenesis protein CcdA